MDACMLSHVQLRNPTDCSPPGSSVHGISQAIILEWVAVSSSEGSSLPRDPTRIPCVSFIGRWVLYHLGMRGGDTTGQSGLCRKRRWARGSPSGSTGVRGRDGTCCMWPA